MNKKISLLILLVLTLILPGCGQQAATGEPERVPVRLEPAVTGSIREAVNFSGEVTAGSEVQVVPKTAGRIARVAVTMGQEVKKGDLLVVLEAQELAIALRQAEATLEMARANLNNVRSGGTLSQLRAGKLQAEAQYSNAKVALARMEALYAQGGISLQQLEGTRLQLQVAESQYNLAKEQLELFERGEGQTEVLTAQVKQAEAGLEMARLNYNNARIIAPVTGVVAMVNAEVGNMASPGMPVVILVDMAGVTVTARLTEQLVATVFPGAAVSVEIGSMQQTFAGEVREVAPSPLTGTKMYPVKIRLAEAPGVMPGMFVRVTVNVAASENAVLVPRGALLEKDGQDYVFTLKDGKAVRTDVVVGIKDEQFAEILGGLSEGQQVVTTGQHYLREGVPVLVEAGGER